MRNKNRDLQSVEDFQNLRDALAAATTSHRNDTEEVAASSCHPHTIDDLPDDSRLAFTDTIFMHAGMSLSQIGLQIGLEAPSTLQEVHRRGEIFMFSTLGAVAVYEATKTVSELL